MYAAPSKEEPVSFLKDQSNAMSNIVEIGAAVWQSKQDRRSYFRNYNISMDFKYLAYRLEFSVYNNPCVSESGKFFKGNLSLFHWILSQLSFEINFIKKQIPAKSNSGILYHIFVSFLM